jgi:hypothetical protein
LCKAEQVDERLRGELVALEHAVQEAVRRHDRDVLEDLLAPEFRLITSRGGNPRDREDWIAAATGPFQVDSYELSDFQVVALGDTAVVTRHDLQEARMGTRRAHRSWLTTDVWVREGQRWRLLARHAEPLAEEG